MSLWRRLLRRPARPPETGEENARRFAAFVTEEAHDERFIQAWATAGYTTINQRRAGWVWMMNDRWRARVLELLKSAPIRDAQFIAPDSMDGWTFHAYSTVPVPRIAKLDLSDTL